MKTKPLNAVQMVHETIDGDVAYDLFIQISSNPGQI